jgi:hypothetical protein
MLIKLGQQFNCQFQSAAQSAGTSGDGGEKMPTVLGYCSLSLFSIPGNRLLCPKSLRLRISSKSASGGWLNFSAYWLPQKKLDPALDID